LGSGPMVAARGGKNVKGEKAHTRAKREVTNGSLEKVWGEKKKLLTGYEAQHHLSNQGQKIAVRPP